MTANAIDCWNCPPDPMAVGLGAPRAASLVTVSTAFPETVPDLAPALITEGAKAIVRVQLAPSFRVPPLVRQVVGLPKEK